MELSPRKRAVLAAVTKAYIASGEPVGSKALTSLLENAPSSATIRSEMSQLTDLGLLSQPHTSAGRVPTSNGFKVYVDSLMPTHQISDTDRAFIDARLRNIHTELEKISEIAGRIVSELTGLPAVTCFLSASPPRLKKVELVPVSRRSVLLLLVTADGRAQSRIFRTNGDGGLYETFGEIVSRKIIGRPISELTRAYMQSVIAGAGADSLVLTPLLSAVFEMAEGMELTRVSLAGEAQLYRICPSDGAARRITSLVKLHDPILSVMDRVEGDVGVVFGSDTDFRELNAYAVVAARYGGGKYKGTVGLIGPNRISYERIIPSVEYIAVRLSELMTEAEKDMEE